MKDFSKNIKPLPKVSYPNWKVRKAYSMLLAAYDDGLLTKDQFIQESFVLFS